MKKILAVIILGLSLTGCATFSSDIATIKQGFTNLVSPANADAVQASYGAALAVAVNYRRLCASKAINKSCWKVIAAVQPYENNAYGAIKGMRAFIKANPTADATSFIQGAKDAVSAFKSVQAASGVN